MALIDTIPDDWRVALTPAVQDSSFQQLDDFIAAERLRTDTAIYPSEADVFNALRLTSLASVRAVILGQDPYHGEGEAHGLAFSVRPDTKPPGSLVNILNEWEADLRLGSAPSGSLEPWARHGVLLLNTIMTVRRDKANSHRRRGWEPFTDAIIRAVSARPDPIAFLLWGRPARRKQTLVDGRHVVIESNHPSPLSATKPPIPFRGSKPFSTANHRLADLGRPPIDWSLIAAG